MPASEWQTVKHFAANGTIKEAPWKSSSFNSRQQAAYFCSNNLGFSSHQNKALSDILAHRGSKTRHNPQNQVDPWRLLAAKINILYFISASSHLCFSLCYFSFLCWLVVSVSLTVCSSLPRWIMPPPGWWLTRKWSAPTLTERLSARCLMVTNTLTPTNSNPDSTGTRGETDVGGEITQPSQCSLRTTLCVAVSKPASCGLI